MRLSRHRVAPAADQEVEIGAVMGLADVLDIQAGIAAGRHDRRRRLPRFAAARELFVRHHQLQPASRHVELDHVAVFDERQRAAGGGLGTDM